jgi:iron complex transport system substrate-binding protein
VAAHPSKLIALVAAAAAGLHLSTALAAPAQRIVSLVPAITEMLYAIGAGPSVAGVSSFDTYPPEVKKLPAVGALLDPDMEKILSLRPDLVAVYGSQNDLKLRLSRAGIGVFEYRHGGLADVTDTIGRLGAATGRESDAARVVSEIERRLRAVRERVASRPRPRTLLVFGREPLSLRNLYASGAVGFLHDILEVAGGANVFGDLDRESVPVSSEALLAKRPDVILELRIGERPPPDQVRREREPWLRFASVPAVRNNRIEILYGDHLVVPGPRVGRAAEEIARALHPAAFK